ncbi:MAG: hypothetical protein MJ239_03060 [Bacilli bacterium]|nr:hypothetical protein [Bacilli bacterium]
MNNKRIFLLLASSSVLVGCVNNTNSSSSTEIDDDQHAYEMISKAYDYLGKYKGDFCRTNSFQMTELGQDLDSYKEKIIYDSDSNECLYQMEKNNDLLYRYFNKKEASGDSYGMYVSTSVDDQKLKYKSTEKCINHLMNLYDDPIRYTDYDDVLVDVEDFEPLCLLNGVVDLSNSGQYAFLKQATSQDGLEYFKEYFTLIFSEVTESPRKLNDFSSSFAYEKVNGITSVKFSGVSSTTFEGMDEFDKTSIDLTIDYVFEIDDESRFTSIERNISLDNRNYKDGQEVEEYGYNFALFNVETFDYDIKDWALSEDVEGYVVVDEYPMRSLEIELFQTCNGLTYSSSGTRRNLSGDETIDFKWLDEVADIIPNQYNLEYRVEGTKIEEVYLDPECTKVFAGTDMKMGRLELYCTYDYKENVCIATNRSITDISSYNYKFGNEILFDDRVSYSYESNLIDFSGTKVMHFDESDFEIYDNPIGPTVLQSVTVDDKTYNKAALLEGIAYNLTNGTVITANYALSD